MSCTDVQTIQAGNNTKVQFSFDFPYIFKSEIHVYFWNATTKEWDEKLTTDATYPWQITDANPTIVEFTGTAPPAPATPVDPNEQTVDNVRIRRITQVDDIRALFNPGSAIRSDDLNKNFEQVRYAIQEANCQGVTDDVDQFLRDYYWDRFDNTLYSTETWRSNDATIATTASLDARFQDQVNDTFTKAELAAANDVLPDNDDAVTSTGTVKDYVDHAIETDILIDNTGLSKVAANGQTTLGIAADSVDLDRIKSDDIVASGESWANNDTTIATTAAIDDIIDTAITNDIGVDATGLSVTDDGDGTITLGITAGGVDLDRINPADIITQSEQDAGEAVSDDKVFTSSAAARRFDTLVQVATPATANYEVGKTWLQNDDDLTLSVWNGTGWTAISSGGAFREQPNVVYVDTTGDDASTGHRISNPKQTIKGAIDQINGEIKIDVNAAGFNGGSGYVDGNYTGVSLTHSSGTGIGTGLTASITVSGGAVTAITLSAAQQTTLEEYSIGDILTTSNTNLGGSGAGLLIPITGSGDGQIVIVAAGVYREITPIQIKRRNVSIIGQALRSCLVHPTTATENNTLFELNSGSYVSQLTLTGVKAGSGTGNTLDPDLPTTQGWNFAFYNNAFIVKSPYIQNCTNFSDSEINNTNLNAHNPAGGTAGDLDSAPTGGGLLINGATPHDNSPLRSMVCDSYTHVGLNGPGILVVNNGYCQATSSYAFFNKYHIKCRTGGQANLAASTTDFGEKALVADGKSSSAIFDSTVDGAVTRNLDNDPPIVSFNIKQPGNVNWHGTASRPQGNMLVEVTHPTSGVVTYPVLSAATYTDTDGNAGWTVTISRPNVNNRSINEGLEDDIADGAAVSFYLRSQIASSGHTMEYVGSGTNYSALPENGGVPDDTKQINETNGGKIWTATTDQNGKFSVGDFFNIDQRTGFVSFSAGSVAFDLVTDSTPELGGELDALTNKIVNLGDPTAAQDAATKNYVDTQIGGIDEVVEDLTPQLGGNLDVQANSITTSTTDGNIVLNPNGTGTVDVSTSRITSVNDPSNAQDAATKNYVDNAVSGFSTNSITQGDSNVTVTDTGTGNVKINVDNVEVAEFLTGGINFNKGIAVTGPIATVDGGDILITDAANNYIGFSTPATLTASTDFILPDGDGSAGQFLKTDGSANLSWGSVSTDSISNNDSSVTVVDNGVQNGSVEIRTDNVLQAKFGSGASNFSSHVELANQKEVRYYETTANGTNYLGFKAPASVTADVTFTLPDGDGTAGQALTTNGTGTLSWADAGGGGATGGGSDKVFQENLLTVDTDYTIGTNIGGTALIGSGASCVGPITVASGITLTVPANARLVVL